MTSPLPAIPPLTRLHPLIWRLTGGNPSKFTLQGTNTYLLGAGSERILIDTGEGFPIWSENLHNLLAEEKTAVKHVLLTHHHLDHTGGLNDIPAHPSGQTVWRYPAAPSTEHYRNALQQALNAWNRPTGELTDGKTFAIPGTERIVLRTIHTPGHTPDHCAFLLESEGGDEAQPPILFTGDAVLGHGTAVFEDLAVYIDSLHKMQDVVAGKGTVAFPAHGEVVADAAGKIGEYIEHRAQRERQVLDVLQGDGTRSGLLPGDVVAVVYREYPKELWGPAEGGVKLILGKLEGERRVERVGERWRVVGEKAGL